MDPDEGDGLGTKGEKTADKGSGSSSAGSSQLIAVQTSCLSVREG